jgi:hypothetical protein
MLLHFKIYSGCQKNVPIAERFFATTLMPPSFFRNIIMASGINREIMHFDYRMSARYRREVGCETENREPQRVSWNRKFRKVYMNLYLQRWTFSTYFKNAGN